jgi:hypothetical protein
LLTWNLIHKVSLRRADVFFILFMRQRGMVFYKWGSLWAVDIRQLACCKGTGSPLYAGTNATKPRRQFSLNWRQSISTPGTLVKASDQVKMPCLTQTIVGKLVIWMTMLLCYSDCHYERKADGFPNCRPWQFQDLVNQSSPNQHETYIQDMPAPLHCIYWQDSNFNVLLTWKVSTNFVRAKGRGNFKVLRSLVTMDL